jgi:single-stranded DNA-specific DHH superfamily exonuclease
VLADFALRAEELRAAVVAERGEGGVHISVRSKDDKFSAFALVRAALAGLGSGGGHAHSAGGFVPAASDPGEEKLREMFFKATAEAVVGLQ